MPQPRGRGGEQQGRSCAPPPSDKVDEWFAEAAAALVQHAQGKAPALGGADAIAAAGGRAARLRSAATAEAQTRLAALSTSSDKVGVSFAGAAFQERYFATKLARRGRLLFDVLCDLHVDFPPGMVRVASFGGGPGTDASGLVALQRQRCRGTAFECVLYDNEPSWKRYLKTLGELFAPEVAVDFAACDVTRPLGDPANLKVSLSDVDLMLFFYVCHETSARASQGGYGFYTDLAAVAKPGCLIVIADVMGHSHAAIAAVTAKIGSVRKFEELSLSAGHNAYVVAVRLH